MKKGFLVNNVTWRKDQTFFLYPIVLIQIRTLLPSSPIPIMHYNQENQRKW